MEDYAPSSYGSLTICFDRNPRFIGSWGNDGKSIFCGGHLVSPEAKKSRINIGEGFGGREGIRTPGLLVANEALSQLSYSPTSSKEILAEANMLAKQDDLG
jgi:hypothetical protein